MTNHHQCGYAARAREGPAGELEVIIQLEGVENEIPPLVVFSVPDTEENLPQQGMMLVVAQAICHYLNLEGDLTPVRGLLDKVATLSTLSLKAAGHVLFAVLPSGDGPTIILRQPNERYVRIVLGDEGFTETLTVRQMKEVLGYVPNAIGAGSAPHADL